MLDVGYPDPAVQLILGLLAFPLWSAVLVLAMDQRIPLKILIACVVVSMASLIVICIFGSLRLMGVLSDDLWALTGTGLRVLVDVMAVVCLLASAR